MILAIIVAAAAAFYLLGLRKRQRIAPDSAAGELSLRPAVPSLPPVLLPERPESADVEQLRFSVALRGYRCREVDQVLARLAAQLKRSEERIDQLEATRPVSGRDHSGASAEPGDDAERAGGAQ